MTPQMAFQRKGGPPEAPPAEVEAMPEGGEGVECPNCQCQFDPDSGDVISEGKPVEGGGYEEGGQEMQMPTPAPVEQAPAGQDAVTQALASVLGR